MNNLVLLSDESRNEQSYNNAHYSDESPAAFCFEFVVLPVDDSFYIKPLLLRALAR